MSHGHADTVRAFYGAVDRRDADALASLVKTSFSEDAAAVWPDSLPYGGRVEGASRLARVFANMAASPVPAGPANIEVVSVLEDGDLVAAQLTFDWHAPGSAESIPSGALELWSFAAGRVSEIRAYYWDAAACLALVGKQQVAPP